MLEKKKQKVKENFAQLNSVSEIFVTYFLQADHLGK